MPRSVTPRTLLNLVPDLRGELRQGLEIGADDLDRIDALTPEIASSMLS